MNHYLIEAYLFLTRLNEVLILDLQLIFDFMHFFLPMFRYIIFSFDENF